MALDGPSGRWHNARVEHLEVGGTDLAYIDTGSGPETVVFSHSYLVDHRHFTPQIDALSATHRVVAYDHRDHGESRHASAPYELDDLVADGRAVLDGLGIDRCHWIGLSTGGFVGMRLALAEPERFATLTLMDTSAQRDDPRTRIKNRGLLLALRAVGIRPLLGTAMATMFAPAFRKDPARQDEVSLWRQRIAANDRDALIRFGNAIFGRDDILATLAALDVPTHVVVGEDDRATPPRFARAMAETIPGATLSVIPDAGHLCTIDQPAAVNDRLTEFLAVHSAA